MLKIEAFVVALIWSPGRNCATDWILKYTPSRVLQTMDTNRKKAEIRATMSGSWIINATSDVFNAGTFADLEGPLAV